MSTFGRILPTAFVSFLALMFLFSFFVAVFYSKGTQVVDCPTGYVFVQESTFNSSPWCVSADGSNGIKPTYSRIDRGWFK